MFVSETTLRVRYAETDQMGYVYYGNYPQYYEVGRVECMRHLGTSYKAMEDLGVMMPVIEMKINYFRAGRYDDLLTIRTTITEIPETRMNFMYEIFNEAKVLLNRGETTLIFVSKEKNKPVRCPAWLKELCIMAFKASE